MEIPHDLDPPIDETECNRMKARWREQHRWRDPPPVQAYEIAGDIDEAAAALFAAAIGRAPDAPIYLTLTSAGGDPIAAARAYDAMRQHAAPIHIHVPERCSSAAVVVLLGADKRSAAPGARLRLHFVEFAVPRAGRQTAEIMRQGAAQLEEIDEDMAAIIGMRCSRYPDWKLRRDMHDERTLDAAEAWLFGLLTERP
jgi:ATP-dependent protease ClpP protease subunit